MDLYAILDVPVDAAMKDITVAFRKLAVKFHPDRNRGNEKEAEVQFQNIRNAYVILSDEQKRNEYDSKHNLNISRRIAAVSRRL